MNQEALIKYIENNRSEVNDLIQEIRYEFIQQDFQELGESDVLLLYLDGKGAYATPENLTLAQILEELTDAIDAFKDHQLSCAGLERFIH